MNYLVAGAIAVGALVSIYMTRPRFPRVTQSAAIFFRDQPVPSGARYFAWGPFRPTSLFVVQLIVVLLLFASILSYHFPYGADRTELLGIWVLIDRSASMSTIQGGGTRMDAALTALAGVVDWPWPVGRCFRLSAFDLEPQPLADDARTAAEVRNATAGLAPRALGTDLTLVQSALAARDSNEQSGCRVNVVVVITDTPAPPWMDAAAARGDAWLDVSRPVGNIGLTAIASDRDEFTGNVERVRVHVERFGGFRDDAELRVRWPDDEEQRFKAQGSNGRASVYEFAPDRPGRYRISLSAGGAYKHDDEAQIDVPAVNAIRVDWRVGRRDLLSQLAWVHDAGTPDLRVIALGDTLDDQPTIVVGPGYERAAAVVPVFDFLDNNPLLLALNLDVAERAGMPTIALPPGFEPVLRGELAIPWIAQRASPPAVYVPGVPVDGDDNVARFSTTLFLNAARWVLQQRPVAPLYRLTSARQPEPSGNVIALHPDEGNTGRTPRSAGTLEAAARVRSEAEVERSGIWPWLLLAATIAFLVERWLSLVRAWP